MFPNELINYWVDKTSSLVCKQWLYVWRQKEIKIISLMYIKDLSIFPKIVKLELQEHKTIPALPHLTSLTIYNDALNYISIFTKLESLCINGDTTLTTIPLTITKLKLYNTNFTHVNSNTTSLILLNNYHIHHLKNLTNLKTLSLINTGIHDIPTTVTQLRIDNNYPNNDLRKLTHVQDLTLYKNIQKTDIFYHLYTYLRNNLLSLTLDQCIYPTTTRLENLLPNTSIYYR